MIWIKPGRLSNRFGFEASVGEFPEAADIEYCRVAEVLQCLAAQRRATAGVAVDEHRLVFRKGCVVGRAFTCTEEMAKKHPELVVTFMMGRRGNENKHPAATILDKQTYYLDVEDTYRNIVNVDLVPNLSPQNLAAIEIGKDFMLSHGYIKNDFDEKKSAAPEFLEQAAKELINERWEKVTGDKLPDASTARLG